MSENGMDCTTGVGRLVWGDVSVPRIKKHNDGAQKGQPVIDATTGLPVKEIAFGVAFPKAEFEQMIWPTMGAEIATGYPNGTPPRFSFKYADGDGIDPDGLPYNQREGYAGCYVLAYTQRINEYFAPPPLFQFNPQTQQYNTLQPGAINLGDYVSVGTNFKVNVATGTNTPSVYVNPKGVELVGYGQRIVPKNAPNPTQMFGGRQHQLPAGASLTPLQTQGQPGMPGMTGAMPGGSGMGGMPQPGQMGQPGMMQQPQMQPQPGMMQQPMMQPQQQPQPGMVQPQPMAQPGQMQPGMPMGQPGMMQQPQPMAQPGQLPAPAYDFVQPGMQQPQPQPMMQQPQPGQMMPGQPHPGMMPGAIPGR